MAESSTSGLFDDDASDLFGPPQPGANDLGLLPDDEVQDGSHHDNDGVSATKDGHKNSHANQNNSHIIVEHRRDIPASASSHVSEKATTVRFENRVVVDSASAVKKIRKKRTTNKTAGGAHHHHAAQQANSSSQHTQANSSSLSEYSQKTAFDEAVERIKQRRQKKNLIGENQAQETVHDMIQRMIAAADLDDAAVSAGKPATAKLALVDEASREIQKPNWTNWYLQSGICMVLDRWMMPLADGVSPPNVTLRKKVYQLLAKINLTSDFLQDCDLGNKLVYYWKMQQETDENRQLIKQIVTSVLKPFISMYSRSSSSASRFQHEDDIMMVDEEEDATMPSSRTTAPTSATFRSTSSTNILAATSGAGNTKANRSTLRATIPLAAPRTYTIKPKSNVNLVPMGGDSKRTTTSGGVGRSGNRRC